MKRKKIKTTKMNYKTRPITWGAYLNTSKLDSKLFNLENVHANPKDMFFFCIAISHSFLHCNFAFLLFVLLSKTFVFLFWTSLHVIVLQNVLNLTWQITHITNTQRIIAFTTWFCDGLKIQNLAQNWFRIVFFDAKSNFGPCQNFL
jgi:hypothetical protein